MSLIGVKELNKHSEVKISTGKGKIDGIRFTRQNNRFEPGGTEEMHLVSGNVKRFRLKPQDKKTKISKLMLGNFFSNYSLLLLFL